MAHYAILDDNNVVINVIVGKDEDQGVDYEQIYSESVGSTVLRTSINTFRNVHSAGKEPFRKNFAAVGGSYDPELDAFIPIQPYPSWVLNTSTCNWEAPIPHEERDNGIWFWVEENPPSESQLVQGWNFNPVDN